MLKRVQGLRLFSSIYNYTQPGNPQVFLEVSTDSKPMGKLIFELYENHCPQTTKNFTSLCVGEDDLSFKGSHFHRIIEGFMAQGGDITNHNGTGGISIYGPLFKDENLSLKHYKKGMLSMANSGPNSNNSQFFITFEQTPWLDGYHVVFGELVEGNDILDQIEQSGSWNGEPKENIFISDAGMLNPSNI